MVEIPEHLRKRAAEARAKAEGRSSNETVGDTSPTDAAPPDSAPSVPSADGEKIPAHLLERGTPAADQPSSSRRRSTTVPSRQGIAAPPS